MKLLRPVSEAEVVAEFLRNEFHHREFERDRYRFESLVRQPVITDPTQNALRRALLFRRRATLWRELPADTQWWQGELEASDLGRLCVFSRTYWRSIGGGSIRLKDIVQEIRENDFRGKMALGGTATGGLGLTDVGAVVQRVRELSKRIAGEHGGSAIIVIATSPHDRLTILEGNHRLTAALLHSPDTLLRQFRNFTGISPRMVQCCWYRTDLPNLLRYARHRLQNLGYDPDADISRVLMPAPGSPREPLDTLTARKVMPESK